MNDKDLPLEEKLALAVARFARLNSATFRFQPHPPHNPTELFFSITKLGGQDSEGSNFLCAIKMKIDGKLNPPIYVSQGTPYPIEFYRSFCRFLDEHFDVPYEAR